ncbi:MAG TPA: fumarylacetoacetate hydrolase family protein [Bryobacteraceae bacterium]|nr:fumarylacetoacetate hydrolase family protein [Bryobacteraceae bacterium]
MKFVTFQRPGAPPEPGLITDGRVLGLGGAGFPDLLSVIAGGDEARRRIEQFAAAAPASAFAELSAVTLRAPIPRPPKIICVGLNFADHAAESGLPIPKVPTIFSKFSTAVIGPGEPIVLPRSSSQPDYEAELAFVIGKGGRHIPATRWEEHVFGYTNFNDVSARDYQMATTQWLMGKTFDTFAPMGPWLITADEIADPHALDIACEINGEVLQHSNTRQFIFRIPELIAFLSSVFTLEPGDVVSTGTPPGVGFARKPPRFLKPGDEVVVRIQGLGELRNPVVAE